VLKETSLETFRAELKLTQKSTDMPRRYVIVSPVRDEDEYIERTIFGVVQQTIRPKEWIIVNDGSRDRTREIIDSYARKYRWVRAVHRIDRGKRVPGSGVMEAFYDGYNRLESDDWDFIVKLDGDVALPPDYFEQCFRRFAEEPKLGMCGGRMYCGKDGNLKPELHPAFHVRGPIKLYRRECWKAIGGLIKAPGWDTLDEVQANRFGWRTITFDEIKVLHLRPTGAVQGVWRDGVKMGRAAYICGYHPLFMMMKCVKRTFSKPYVLSSLAHGYGFVSGYFKNVTQFQDRALIRYLRKQQLRRLFLLDSIWK
jgi:biofilm PGA synthesis N-glycosyltransferase PgaC